MHHMHRIISTAPRQGRKWGWVTSSSTADRNGRSEAGAPRSSLVSGSS
jgi:hypothetical protein